MGRIIVSRVEIPGPNTERTCSGEPSRNHEKPKEQIAMERTSATNAKERTQESAIMEVTVTWKMTAQGTRVESSSHTADATLPQCIALI